MAAFPLLKTGSVTQYPLQAMTGQASQVIRFLDGTDQRYMTHARPLRAWQIHLDLLDEDEISSLEAFFRGQLGGYSTFDFPDPISGSSVPFCRLGDDTLVTEYLETDNAASSFWIIETYG
ncbi:MAG TPA: hypothetical protein VKX25_02815 [Bryobacteraceae bacterium]|jgi:hypothetical protein|nr:hypothetical protein [Bryobacteraceae bacterium]